jgi:hypothetical protein
MTAVIHDHCEQAKARRDLFIRRVPPILLAACSLPRLDPVYALPWVEGHYALATDGAIVVAAHKSSMPADAFHALPGWSAEKPRGLREWMEQFGPFGKRPLELPGFDEMPDRERPACDECKATGLVTAGGEASRRLIPRGTTLALCRACCGAGCQPLTGIPVWFNECRVLGFRVGLDAWYVTMLRRHVAVVYPPLGVQRDRVDPFHFRVGDQILGLVQPVAEPIGGRPWESA